MRPGSEVDSVGFFGGDDDEHRQGEDSAIFSSTLSANEFALLSELGPQPLAQVMGTSVYQVGWQYLPPSAQWGTSNFHSRLDVVDQAWNAARALAFGRLIEEARSVGADAVVAVELRRGEHEWARRSVDYLVSGTAIRMPDGQRAVGRDPLLSDLSVQDYWKLVRGGWAPSGLLAATAVFFVSQGFSTRFARRASFFRNQHLSEFSDGFGAARRAVVDDLRLQARDHGADGVVGVTLDYRLERRTIRVMRVQQRTGVTVGTIGLAGGAVPQAGGSDSRDGIVFTVHAVGTGVRRTTSGSADLTPTMINVGAVR